jgi:putative transposase
VLECRTEPQRPCLVRYAATWRPTRWNRLSARVATPTASSTTVTAASRPGSRGRRYTERLAEAGIASSVGSVGDAYDNALAETIIGLYKTEVIEQLEPWYSMTHVEIETVDWVDLFNNRRLLEPIGNVPPAEFEALYDRSQRVAAVVAGLK